MAHSLVVFPNGNVSVKLVGASEAMHSLIGPWQEANALYVVQSNLASRLALPGLEPLVLYDIGLGIAANALAALTCFFDAAPARDLRILSFEKHLDGLRLARTHSKMFPFFSGFESAIDELLAVHSWRGKSGEHSVVWELHEGDFLEQDISNLPAPEIIFYDFYSPKTQPALWTATCFEKIYKQCRSRIDQGQGSFLFTYSVATSIRSALILAGFSVGAGSSTEAKRETTVAATMLTDLCRPLGAQWLGKLERSTKPLPLDWGIGRKEEAFTRIRQAPQFLLKSSP